METLLDFDRGRAANINKILLNLFINHPVQYNQTGHLTPQACNDLIFINIFIVCTRFGIYKVLIGF